MFVLKKLTDLELESVLRRAVDLWRDQHAEEPWVDQGLAVLLPPTTTSSPSASTAPALLSTLASMADGDCRVALNGLEVVLKSIEARSRRAVTEGRSTDEIWDEGGLAKLKQGLKDSLSLSHDRTGDAHYDLISALHKSM